jgi:hypothetical protein
MGAGRDSLVRHKASVTRHLQGITRHLSTRPGANERKKNEMRMSIVLIIAVVGPYATAQVAERSFESRMSAIERLDYHDPIRFAGLGERDRRALLACRSAVVAVLKGVGRTDLRPYLTPELARKYPTSEALAKSLIAPETTLLAVGVREFDFDDSNGIRLKVFVFVAAEGLTAVPEKVWSCRGSGDRWRVSGFE